MDAFVKELLRGLASDEACERVAAASDLGYLFERIYLNRFRMAPQCLLACIENLKEAFLRESDLDARETMLASLVDGAITEAGLAVNWDPLAAFLPALNGQLLEYALTILGFSKNQNYRGLIENHQANLNRDIRRVAKEALAEFPIVERSSASDG